MTIFRGEISPRIHIGNGISVLESDVDEVMSFARVSRSSAIVALRENEGNVSEALYDLDQTESDEEEFVPLNLDDNRELSVPDWMIYE